MKKQTLSIFIIVLILAIALGIYFYLNNSSHKNDKDKYSEITYDACAQKVLKDVRNYKPASEEPIGAKRTDNEGNIWTKTDEITGYTYDENGNKITQYNWKTNAAGYENVRWGDLLIDKQVGGAEYTPENFPQCEKYIFTRNAEMEKGFQEILDEVVAEQAQRGVIISVKDVRAINLAGRMQGLFILNCQDINDENEEEIIGSIANKLFEKYPNEFAENSGRDSWIDIHCVYDMGWRISDGNYGMMV